jgi:hypothetical protein
MRAVQLADVDAAALVLLSIEPDMRGPLAVQLCWNAAVADRFRKRLKRPHPKFGSGSLMSAAATFPQARRPLQGSIEYLECIRIVITAVLARRSHNIA